MTNRHLNIFITVCNEGSMTRAANKLFMTQPSVSQAIKELESYYDVRLFERLSRKIFVTDAGRNLYEYASHIVSLYVKAEDSLKRNGLRKNLSIGVNYTVGAVLIHRYIREYRALYTDAKVSIYVNKSSDLVKMIRKGELDFALTEEVNHEFDLVQRAFYKDRIVIVASPAHSIFNHNKITVEDIIKEDLLLREKGAGVRNLFEAKMSDWGFPVNPIWESTSTTALVKAAENNFGLAVLPMQLVQQELAAGTLKEVVVKDLNLDRKLMVVYHRNKLLTDYMQDFVNLCYK